MFIGVVKFGWVGHDGVGCHAGVGSVKVWWDGVGHGGVGWGGSCSGGVDWVIKG